LARAEIDLGLVVDANLASPERQAQLVLESQRLDELVSELVAEDLDAAAAPLLGGVHGDVGAADELVGRAAVTRMHGDSGAGPEREQVAAELDRLGDARQEARGDVDRLLLAGAVQQDGELVASDPGDGVSRAQRVLEPAGDRDQELVAGIVP